MNGKWILADYRLVGKSKSHSVVHVLIRSECKRFPIVQTVPLAADIVHGDMTAIGDNRSKVLGFTIRQKTSNFLSANGG